MLLVTENAIPEQTDTSFGDKDNEEDGGDNVLPDRVLSVRRQYNVQKIDNLPSFVKSTSFM